MIYGLVEVVRNLGVSSTEDLKFVEPEDLKGSIKPVEVRKLIACIKSEF